MDSIRIKNNNKKIEVNDEGEFITLPFDDQEFPTRFFNLIDFFEKSKDKLQEETDKLKIECSDIAGASYNDIKKVSELSLNFHKQLKNKVDEVFGKDTCKKVFGDMTPSIFMFADFFEQLEPFFEKYAADRKTKIDNKYSAGRMGNV